MDNFTLLAILNIILLINVFFTFFIYRNTGEAGLTEWRISSVFVFTGFFLLQMQRALSPFIAVLIANYFILLGFYYQISATIMFEIGSKKYSRFILPFVSIAYWTLFIYYTYIQFNTPVRIIIISVLFAFLYLYPVLLIGKRFQAKTQPLLYTRELFLLFVFSVFFYAVRVVFTVTGLGAVKSLYDRNLPTTVTFIYIIIYNLIYYMGIFNAFLRYKNNLIIREKEKLGYLFDFLNDTAKHLNLEDLYNSIGEVLRKLLGVDTAAIYLADEDKKILTMAYGFNELDLPLDMVKTVKIGEGAAGRAFEQDRVVEVDIESYSDRAVAEKYKGKGVTTLLSSPIKTSEGVIGAVTAVYSTKTGSEIFDSSFFYYLGEQIGLVIHNAILYEKVNQLANTDPLTGLVNRRKMSELFGQEIKRARRTGKSFTIAMIDIDNFKKVNDTYGHECGDNVLKAVADLFLSECREYDYICRWGGEEFLLLFIDTDLTTAATIAERIRSLFGHKENICMDRCSSTLSVGITEFKPDLTMKQLIDLADDALYSAKKNGRNRVVIS